MKPGKDFIGVGVGAVILDKKDRILLLKRGQNIRNEPGTWVIPGGEVEYNEKIEKTVLREVKEEIGVRVKILGLLGVADQVMAKEKQHWISSIFLCKIVSGQPKIMEPEKCEDLDWFELNKVKKLNLGVMMKQNLKILKNKFPEKFNE